MTDHFDSRITGEPKKDVVLTDQQGREIYQEDYREPARVPTVNQPTPRAAKQLSEAKDYTRLLFGGLASETPSGPMDSEDFEDLVTTLMEESIIIPRKLHAEIRLAGRQILKHIEDGERGLAEELARETAHSIATQWAASTSYKTPEPESESPRDIVRNLPRL